MPFASVNNTRLFYRLEGSKDEPVLVLSHSLGCDLGMWEPQMPDFLYHFQGLRYDTRGHGASAAPAGDYSIDQLGSDVIGLVDALGIRRATLGGYRLLFRLPFASRSRFHTLRHVPDLGPARANASFFWFRVGIHGRLAFSIGDTN